MSSIFFSFLSENCIILTCSCLIGKLTGCGVVYLSDWLEHDQSTLTLWHGGMAPFQLRFVSLSMILALWLGTLSAQVGIFINDPHPVTRHLFSLVSHLYQ